MSKSKAEVGHPLLNKVMCTSWFTGLKKKDDIIQSPKSFPFTTPGIQLKVTKYTGKQDQVTEKLKRRKAKIDQKKVQIFQ